MSLLTRKKAEEIVAAEDAAKRKRRVEKHVARAQQTKHARQVHAEVQSHVERKWREREGAVRAVWRGFKKSDKLDAGSSYSILKLEYATDNSIGEKVAVFTDHETCEAAYQWGIGAGFVPSFGESYVTGLDLPRHTPTVDLVDPTESDLRALFQKL